VRFVELRRSHIASPDKRPLALQEFFITPVAQSTSFCCRIKREIAQSNQAGEKGTGRAAGRIGQKAEPREGMGDDTGF
jgi:hypothetical protein